MTLNDLGVRFKFLWQIFVKLRKPTLACKLCHVNLPAITVIVIKFACKVYKLVSVAGPTFILYTLSYLYIAGENFHDLCFFI